MEALQEKKIPQSKAKALGKGSFFSASPVQTKLKVNQPGDKYEVEADQMAEQVVQKLSDTETNPSPSHNKSESNLFKKPSLQSKSNLPKPHFSSLIQTKCEACEAEEKANEEEVQRKPEPHIFLQAYADGDGEESTLMTKKKNVEPAVVSPETTAQLFASKGSGDPLPNNTKSEMERGFGVDFSHVRTHTGISANSMSKNLGAQAFTHGSDIYFNSGKFDTNSLSGKKLLAHELTHVVQQGKSIKTLQRQDESDEPVFVPTDEQLSESEEGTAIEMTGLVQHDEGTFLWPNPDRSQPALGLLPLNTRLFVDRIDKSNWYSVFVEDHQLGKSLPVAKGTFGYIPYERINLDLPDNRSWLHRINKDGQGALEVAGEVFPDYDPDCFVAGHVCKDDWRYLVNVLVTVNAAKNRRFIYKENESDEWDKAKTKKGQIWVPSLDLVNSLKGQVSSGSISYEVASTLADIGLGIAGFVVGLLEGVIMSIADVFIGLYDILVMVKDIIVKLVKGTLISDAKSFFDDISKISIKDILEMVGQKWNQPNTYEKWKFRGYVIGYAIVEILMLVFSGGIITAIKWVGKIGKFGKLASYLAKFPRIEKLMKAAEGLAGKEIEKVRETLKAAQAISELHAWAAKAFKLPISILQRLSKADIKQLKKLPQWVREQFSMVADSVKLRLLGCSSPCKVDIYAIETALKLATKGGKLLLTPDDILAALPKTLNKIKISIKLRKADSGLLKVIKEAGITDTDFAKLADFLTVGDNGPAQAYKTFSRYITNLIPTKTGKDIKKFNNIIAEMMKVEPGRGAALKGAMFENWVALHVPQLSSLTFQRIAFDVKLLLKKTTPPFKRTVDKWVPDDGAIWDMKHYLGKVPTDQVDDYAGLIGKLAPDGKTVKEVNYLFPTKDVAQLNKHLADTYKFGVYYIDEATNVLTKL